MGHDREVISLNCTVSTNEGGAVPAASTGLSTLSRLLEFAFDLGSVSPPGTGSFSLCLFQF